jgi:hypothetical protein
MRRAILSGLMLAGLACAAAANAECIYPKAPADIPNGAKATEAEMVAGMKAVKEYNTQVSAYLSCLDMQMETDIAAAGTDAPADQVAQIKAINAKRHNAAVDALEAQAARFNEQVKAYKSRDKEKKS